MKNFIICFITIIMTVNAIFIPVMSQENTQPNVELSDINDHWAKDGILKMVQLGVVNGYEDKTFKPDNSISRAEFVKMLVMADVKNNPTELGKLNSFSGEHWAQKYIQYADEGSYSMPSTCKTDPDGEIQRHEIAQMLVMRDSIVNQTKMDTEKVIYYTHHFEDGNSYSDALWNMLFAYMNGLIKGYPDNTLKMMNGATRAEAMVLLSRYLKLIDREIPDVYKFLPLDGIGLDDSEVARLKTYPMDKLLGPYIEGRFKGFEDYSSSKNITELNLTASYAKKSIETFHNFNYKTTTQEEFREKFKKLYEEGEVDSKVNKWYDLFKKNQVIVQGNFYTDNRLIYKASDSIM